jgi:hypothetical protein
MKLLVYLLTMSSNGSHLYSTIHSQKRFILRRLTQDVIKPGRAGSRHVTPLEAEAYGTGQAVILFTLQTVLSGAVCSHITARPAARQSFSLSGELQAGGNSICLCLTEVL